MRFLSVSLCTQVFFFFVIENGEILFSSYKEVLQKFCMSLKKPYQIIDHFLDKTSSKLSLVTFGDKTSKAQQHFTTFCIVFVQKINSSIFSNRLIPVRVTVGLA